LKDLEGRPPTGLQCASDPWALHCRAKYTLSRTNESVSVIATVHFLHNSDLMEWISEAKGA